MCDVFQVGGDDRSSDRKGKEEWIWIFCSERGGFEEDMVY